MLIFAELDQRVLYFNSKSSLPANPSCSPTRLTAPPTGSGCLCACVCVCVYTYLYIYIYIYTYILLHGPSLSIYQKVYLKVEIVPCMEHMSVTQCFLFAMI